jgi:hypothetical protein
MPTLVLNMNSDFQSEPTCIVWIRGLKLNSLFDAISLVSLRLFVHALFLIRCRTPWAI